MKIKVTYDTNAKEATEIIAQAVEAGAEWELCESDSQPTKTPTGRPRKLKVGDRIVVSRPNQKYGVVRGDRGTVAEILTNGRKRQSYKVEWDDGTVGSVAGGLVRRTTK